MLIAIAFFGSRAVKAPLVNWLPWSVLKISGHPFPTNHDALAAQQITQHPTARERVVEMQRVDPPHDRKLGRRYRRRLVVQAAPVQLQQLRLPCQRQTVTTIDHRFALSSPALL